MISREEWKLDLDELEVVLGAWLFFSPWAFGQAEAVINIGILSVLGLLVAADGMWALAKPSMRSPEWVMVLLGLAVMLAPWPLGLMDRFALTWNAWIAGGALILLAGLTFFTKVEEGADRTRMAH